jgi:hypothetical protein
VDWTKGFSCWLVFLDEGGGEPTEKGKVMHWKYTKSCGEEKSLTKQNICKSPCSFW